MTLNGWTTCQSTIASHISFSTENISFIFFIFSKNATRQISIQPTTEVTGLKNMKVVFTFDSGCQKVNYSISAPCCGRYNLCDRMHRSHLSRFIIFAF